MKFTTLNNNEIFENNNHILEYLDYLFTIINDNNEDDIYIQSIPFLNDNFFTYIDIESINILSDNVNRYLKDLCLKYNFDQNGHFFNSFILNFIKHNPFPLFV